MSENVDVIWMKWWPRLVVTWVGDIGEKLFKGCDVRDDSSCLLASTIESRFNPSLPHRIPLIKSHAGDVVAFRVYVLQQNSHLPGMLQADGFLLITHCWS